MNSVFDFPKRLENQMIDIIFCNIKDNISITSFYIIQLQYTLFLRDKRTRIITRPTVRRHAFRRRMQKYARVWIAFRITELVKTDNYYETDLISDWTTKHAISFFLSNFFLKQRKMTLHPVTTAIKAKCPN